MNGNLWVFFLLSGLGSLNADVITQWTFNSSPPDDDVSTGITEPSQGRGLATLVGQTTGTFVTGDMHHDPAGSTDNSGWRTTKYPAADADNKTAGVRFAVDTSGYDHIQLSWCQQNSATASRFSRLQYTTDGVTFYDADSLLVSVDGVFTNIVSDLANVPDAADNPVFGFQIVTEWESSALGGGTDAYMATKEGSKYGTGGTIRFDAVTVSGLPIAGANTPPTISTISNQVLRVNQSSDDLGFLIGDMEEPAENLTVSASSSDPGIMPEANITLGGVGCYRSINLTATAEPGEVWVSLSVSDSGGRSTETKFKVTVLPANTAPVISILARTNTLTNQPTSPLPFLVGDAESPAETLTVSAGSSNLVLVPEANFVFGGSGSNRTVTINPAPGENGIAPIWISVNDGINLAGNVFPLLVTSSPDVLFCDHFAYPDGSLITNSAFAWDTRSGIAGQCQVSNHQLLLCATQTEDVVARLIGAPYTKSNSLVLYAAFNVTFVSLPKPVPGLFAHFADGSTLRGRIYAGTTNAGEGAFRLQVANGASAPVELPIDLSPYTNYRIVTRYVVDDAVTTLWLNPAAESDDAITAADPQNATAIASYAFRQDTDFGATAQIEDFTVGLSFESVTGIKSLKPIALTFESDGMTLRLVWADPSFKLQSAQSLAGPYDDVPNAVSPFETSLDGPGRFFRLRATNLAATIFLQPGRDDFHVVPH